MTPEEQIVKWFKEFREENPSLNDAYIDNGQVIYWLAKRNTSLLIGRNKEESLAILKQEDYGEQVK